MSKSAALCQTTATAEKTKHRVEERMKLKVLLVLIGWVQIAECSVGKWQVK